MEFTKGEWRVVTDATGHTHIMAFDNGFERNVCALSVRSPEQEIANARLISQAPDLYEALRKVSKIIAGRVHIPIALERLSVDINRILAKVKGC